jgi:hypothetical protein
MSTQPAAVLSPTVLTTPGTFVVGCNYWASHAGTLMWRDWQPDVVEADLRRLAAQGVQVLRVFPLWPDFQPLDPLYSAHARFVEVRHGEAPLPRPDGLSETMLDRFAAFCDLLQAHGLTCIVGLLTGWMSGRLHVPALLAGRNVITDPEALRWERRFVHGFVTRFKAHPAILGWDLGNECNCMGGADRHAAYAWTAYIADAIRVADPSRPVVSGMHSLSPTGAWTMADQGELTDLLTTHPYPPFTPHCDNDPINTLRSLLHGTAESRLYADLGGKPCLCQETGTLGNMIASEAVAGDFMRSALFSLWAHDCHGLLWWCANDQTNLAHAPYDWCAVERELGLLRTDGTPKPALLELAAFRRFLDGLPFATLPPHRREAVCLLSRSQDTWGVAYATFILAKQAGFDVEFQYHDQPLREAALYLLPSINGLEILDRRLLLALLERVEAGATLYCSLDNALPSHFAQMTGLEPHTRERRRAPGTFTWEGDTFTLPSEFRLALHPLRAEVLAAEPDGNPAFTVAPLGRGRVFFCSLPVEIGLTRQPGVFHAPDAAPWWRVYRRVAGEVLAARAARPAHPHVVLTEHDLAPDRRLVVAMNLSPAPVADGVALADGWRLADTFRGTPAALPANDAAVFSVIRER